jgi:glutaredoxin-related protein
VASRAGSSPAFGTKNMKKKAFLLILCLLIISVGLLVFTVYFKKNPSNTEITLFYSSKCPHCQEIETFLQKNAVHSKISFAEKEVTENKDNLKKLITITKKCNFPKNNYIELPILWTGSECLIGRDNIINFFTDAIKK